MKKSVTFEFSITTSATITLKEFANSVWEVSAVFHSSQGSFGSAKARLCGVTLAEAIGLTYLACEQRYNEQRELAKSERIALSTHEYLWG